MPTPDDLPRPAPDILTDGVPATDELPEGQLLTGDPVEGEMPPLDHSQGVEDWGTTAAEQLGDEPLAVRARREEPEARLGHAEEAGLALVPPAADDGLLDDETDEVGEANPAFEDTLAPEEAAMRVEEEPAGLNWDPDPGYVDPVE
jgi:hypothetical protein